MLKLKSIFKFKPILSTTSKAYYRKDFYHGDWKCSNCDFFNFGKNVTCKSCNTPKSTESQIFREKIHLKSGDWECPTCNFPNFASRDTCKRCDGKKEFKKFQKQDWKCSQCNFANFEDVENCESCGKTRNNKDRILKFEIPKKIRVGNWMCEDCDFVNFTNRTTCKNCEKPRSVNTNNETKLM